MHARLLIDPPAGGAWNMAVDEALVGAAVAGAPLVLRFYGWTPATLSLGYFQPAAQRMGHRTSLSCPLVRRASGGGAILHDTELTYALIVPAEHSLARQTAGLYRAVHGALAAALVEWNVGAEMFHCGTACAAEGEVDAAGQGSKPHPSPLPQGEGAGVPPLPVGEGPGVRDFDSPPTSPASTPAEKFLCFHRRGEGDLVVAGAKIAGSAQRRRHGAVLQHGSVLLAASPAAPELPGLAELAGRPLDPTALRDQWLARLAAALDLAFEPSALSSSERQAAVDLQHAKYTSPAWTYRR